MVAGLIMVVVGVTTFLLVQRELSDENITVSEDADNFGGQDVNGPFTAYSQATVIKKHALEAGGGLTYAELDRDDPVRDTVMDASFLRASLFTSVVAFGVATLLVGLGLLVILIGLGMFALDKRGQIAIGGGVEPPVAVVPAGAPPAGVPQVDPPPSVDPPPPAGVPQVDPPPPADPATGPT
jgi:hypothetical protein